MIVTNIFEIGFRIPDDMDVLKDFEESNDLFEWSKSESTEYVTYTYISRKQGRNRQTETEQEDEG